MSENKKNNFVYQIQILNCNMFFNKIEKRN